MRFWNRAARDPLRLEEERRPEVESGDFTDAAKRQPAPGFVEVVDVTHHGRARLGTSLVALLPGERSQFPVEPVAQAGSLPLEFRDITEAEARAADELWVTSSSREVLAIVSLDGKPVGEGRPGPVFRRVHQLYQEFKQKVMRAGKERQAA